VASAVSSKHDQSRNLAELQLVMKDNGFWTSQARSHAAQQRVDGILHEAGPATRTRRQRY
jgi:hypothetical protein